MAGKWFPRIVTMALWALVALCASFWALRWTGSGTTSAALALPPSTPPESDPANLARALGPPVAVAAAAVASAPAAVDPASRYTLLGVVANKARKGVALIAVDGKAARPYLVGSVVADGYTLQKVEGRTAVLGSRSSDTPSLTLQLVAPASTPAPSAAALPAASSLPSAMPASPVSPSSAPRLPLAPSRSFLPRPVG